MAAHERHRIATAVIRDRNPRIRGGANRRRHTGHHFEIHTLLVQEQRFLTAAIKKERVAPLETRHDLALARLFGQQVTDRLLIARFGRGAAHVNAFGAFRRHGEEVGMHEMIEEHHVGPLQAAVAAQRNQIRRAGPRTDQVDSGCHDGILRHWAVISALCPRRRVRT
jgi:hypothetical protein